MLSANHHPELVSCITIIFYAHFMGFCTELVTSLNLVKFQTEVSPDKRKRERGYLVLKRNRK